VCRISDYGLIKISDLDGDAPVQRGDRADKRMRLCADDAAMAQRCVD
jgi:hypothetical protein